MPDYYEQIKQLEKELKETKRNKRTEHHIGLVKAKIAKLRESIEKKSSSSKISPGYSVRRTGDASVILVGYPSTGKSSLLNCLTDANSQVEEYAFTTLSVIPGIMKYNFASIQILDVPGIIEGAALGRGRGKEVLSVIRNADLAIIIVDATKHSQYYSIIQELFYAGIRINKKKPDVIINKTTSSGIRIWKSVKLTKLNDRTIKEILREFKIVNAEITIREDISDDDLIDVIEGNKKYMPGIVVVNKTDLIDEVKTQKIIAEINPDLFVSATKNINIDKLKELIFTKLEFIRVYLKEPGKDPDLDVPLIIKKNSTIGDVCERLHKDMLNQFKFARVWGKSAKFDGQIFSKNHVLIDNDILEIHLS